MNNPVQNARHPNDDTDRTARTGLVEAQTCFHDEIIPTVLITEGTPCHVGSGSGQASTKSRGASESFDI